MNKFLRRHNGITLLCVAGALALAACAKKPPACSDAEVAQTIASIIADNTIGQDPTFSDDPQKIQEGYFQALKHDITNVVSDGYNEQAKKYSCRGRLSVSTITGETLSSNIVYSTQRTEGKGSDFLVEIEGFQPFLMAVMSDMNGYYLQKRYAGEWPGTYSCTGIDGAQEEPLGPFSMPVALIVNKDMNAVLERTTLGGGVERLSGHIQPYIRLRGKGKNSSDDTWQTEFEGRVKGMEFTATGKIEAPGRGVLRQCTLKLKLPS